MALVPANDPMVLLNNKPSLTKLNAYRIGVNQKPIQTLAAANTIRYCKKLANVAPLEIMGTMKLFQGVTSPDPGKYRFPCRIE